MAARSSSHPPPRNTVEQLRRNTSRTDQETTNSLQISYRSTYIDHDQNSTYQ